MPPSDRARSRLVSRDFSSAAINALQNCGKSAGVRDEIRFPSTTTALSSQSSPAFTRSSLMAPTLVPRLPFTIPAEIGTHPAWQMKATGFSGLEDLPGELQQLLRPPHDVRGIAARVHQAVEVGRRGSRPRWYPR